MYFNVPNNPFPSLFRARNIRMMRKNIIISYLFKVRHMHLKLYSFNYLYIKIVCNRITYKRRGDHKLLVMYKDSKYGIHSNNHNYIDFSTFPNEDDAVNNTRRGCLIKHIYI